MQKLTHITAALLALLLSLALLVGCNDVDTPPAGTPPASSPTQITIQNGESITLTVGDTLQLTTDAPEDASLAWRASNAAITVSHGGRITAVAPGEATVTVTLLTFTDSITVTVVPKGTVIEYDFYGDFEPPQSHAEALARSQQGELSGLPLVPDQAPTLATYQPSTNGQLIRNTTAWYADDNTYVVTDARGNEVFRVYRDGGYITLEEVAAYVFAFGDVPANYISGKNKSPSSSIWGEYLRLNHSKFSGNTRSYPYEPALPRISGCGGDLQYYEIDIGTTGTDCDPAYPARTYNDGSRITRGAARIVYARFDANGNKVVEDEEKYVFYTYNHYNDFREYLNYYGGWGTMFGNITGGGTLSSRYDYNPTPYVVTVRAALFTVPDDSLTDAASLLLPYLPPRKFLLAA